MRRTVIATVLVVSVLGGRAAAEWTTTTDVSKMDDTTSLEVSELSVDTVPDRLGRPRSLAVMFFCNTGKAHLTGFAVNFCGHFMVTGPVTYRIDKRPAETKTFTASETAGHDNVILEPSGEPFAEELLTGQTLLIQATPFQDNVVTAEFDLAGLADALKPIREVCKW